jgi:hypothetical protein
MLLHVLFNAWPYFFLTLEALHNKNIAYIVPLHYTILPLTEIYIHMIMIWARNFVQAQGPL